jgi:predicted tellurium resistance membrane protein TerC
MENFWHQFDFFTSAEGIMGMLTLCVLEIVLGIDNLVFISILVDKAPKEKQRSIRLTGLSLALIFRVIMLFGITFLTHLQTPVFAIYETAFSWRDIILLLGGLFLIAKSTLEIHHKIMSAGLPHDENKQSKKSTTGLASMMIAQIILIDIIFSIDSILTAVGLTNNVVLMIFAVVVAILFMMLFAKAVSEFINKNPTIVMLALSFLLMIGMLLIADAFHFHVPRGYVYFAMAFSLMVEIFNLILLKRLNRLPGKN